MTIEQYNLLSKADQDKINQLYDEAQEQAGVFELGFEEYLEGRLIPIHQGDRVVFTDCETDERILYTVIEVHGEIFHLKNDAGGECEALEHELEIASEDDVLWLSETNKRTVYDYTSMKLQKVVDYIIESKERGDLSSYSVLSFLHHEIDLLKSKMNDDATGN